MTLYHRASDGATVDAERWDGRPDTALAIMDLIGSMGVNNTCSGTLMITRAGHVSVVRRGSWVVKSAHGFEVVPDDEFKAAYR